jgi:hypothetical protein
LAPSSSTSSARHWPLAGDPAYVAEIDAFIDGIQQIGEQLGEGVIVRREPGGKLVLAMPPTRPRRV